MPDKKQRQSQGPASYILQYDDASTQSDAGSFLEKELEAVNAFVSSQDSESLSQKNATEIQREYVRIRKARRHGENAYHDQGSTLDSQLERQHAAESSPPEKFYPNGIFRCASWKDPMMENYETCCLWRLFPHCYNRACCGAIIGESQTQSLKSLAAVADIDNNDSVSQDVNDIETDIGLTTFGKRTTGGPHVDNIDGVKNDNFGVKTTESSEQHRIREVLSTFGRRAEALQLFQPDIFAPGVMSTLESMTGGIHSSLVRGSNVGLKGAVPLHIVRRIFETLVEIEGLVASPSEDSSPRRPNSNNYTRKKSYSWLDLHVVLFLLFQDHHNFMGIWTTLAQTTSASALLRFLNLILARTKELQVLRVAEQETFHKIRTLLIKQIGRYPWLKKHVSHDTSINNPTSGPPTESAEKPQWNDTTEQRPSEDVQGLSLLEDTISKITALVRPASTSQIDSFLKNSSIVKYKSFVPMSSSERGDSKNIFGRDVKGCSGLLCEIDRDSRRPTHLTNSISIHERRRRISSVEAIFVIRRVYSQWLEEVEDIVQSINTDDSVLHSSASSTAWYWLRLTANTFPYFEALNNRPFLAEDLVGVTQFVTRQIKKHGGLWTYRVPRYRRAQTHFGSDYARVHRLGYEELSTRSSAVITNFILRHRFRFTSNVKIDILLGVENSVLFFQSMVFPQMTIMVRLPA